jgi:hypothetical protein
MRFSADIAGAIPVSGSSYLFLAFSLDERTFRMSGLALRPSSSILGAYILTGENIDLGMVRGG